MPYTASDLRKGLKLRYEGQPYTITEYSFTKPGKGQSIYTCRLKHMLTGNTFVKNFREIEARAPLTVHGAGGLPDLPPWP